MPEEGTEGSEPIVDEIVEAKMVELESVVSIKEIIDRLGQDNLESVKGGKIEGVAWMSILNSSDFKKGVWEAWLGKNWVEPSVKDEAWKYFKDGEIGAVKVSDTPLLGSGYFEQTVGSDGNVYITPTEKLLVFVKSRLLKE